MSNLIMRLEIVAALFLSCFLSGCILPPEIEAEPEADASENGNYPPRIIPNSLDPRQSALNVTPKMLPLILKMGEIEERDLEDKLEVRVFVNYNEEKGSWGVRSISTIEKSPDVVRAGITYEFTANDFPAGGGPAVVEIIVADRPFSLDDSLKPINKAFDPEYKDEVGIDSWQWILHPTACECEKDDDCNAGFLCNRVNCKCEHS